MLHLQMQALLAAARAVGNSPIPALTPVQLREQIARGAASRAPGPDLYDVTDILIDVADLVAPDSPGSPRKVLVRRYRPAEQEPPGTVVYFHSGGWVAGSVAASDALVRHLAVASGCEYLNVEYSLAPENPFPAAVHDALAALRFAIGLGRPVVLHGDSAGGNLAAVAANAARDAGEPDVCLQVLVYPVTDSDLERPSYTERADHGLLAAADMAWFWDRYLPSVEDRADPTASPIRAELTAVAPALVVVAEFDPLRDEGLAYAEALTRAGVPVTLRHYQDAFHGFFALPSVLDRADECIAEVAAAIRSATSIANHA